MVYNPYPELKDNNFSLNRKNFFKNHAKHYRSLHGDPIYLIHIPKNAGKSFASQILFSKDQIANMIETRVDFFDIKNNAKYIPLYFGYNHYDHYTSSQISNIDPKSWDSICSVAIVRHPIKRFFKLLRWLLLILEYDEYYLPYKSLLKLNPQDLIVNILDHELPRDLQKLFCPQFYFTHKVYVENLSTNSCWEKYFMSYPIDERKIFTEKNVKFIIKIENYSDDLSRFGFENIDPNFVLNKEDENDLFKDIQLDKKRHIMEKDVNVEIRKAIKKYYEYDLLNYGYEYNAEKGL